MAKSLILSSIVLMTSLWGCSDDSAPSPKDTGLPVKDSATPSTDTATPLSEAGAPLPDAGGGGDSAITIPGWALSAGGVGDDPAYGVALDSQGNVYAAGTFGSTAAFEGLTLEGTGATDMFLAKVDTTGHFQWAVAGRASEGNAAEAYGVAADAAGNSYVAGEFSGALSFNTTTLTSAGGRDLFVAKFNASGQVQWAKSFGGTGWDRGHAVALDGAGNVIVAGDFEGSVSFGATTLTSAGQTDVFVTKLSADGVPIWALRGGGAGLECDFGFCGVTADGTGNVYLVAYYEETATFGDKQVTSVGSYDVVVVKIDTAGKVLWATSGGGAGEDYGQAITVDNGGNVFITGSFEGNASFGGTNLTSAGSSDVLLARLSPAGAFTWAKAGLGSGYGEGFGITSDGAGNGCVVGSFAGSLDFGGIVAPAAGGHDAFLARFDADGNIHTLQTASSKGTDEGEAVARDGLGRCYVVGSYGGLVSAGGHIRNNIGGSDALIWRADP